MKKFLLILSLLVFQILSLEALILHHRMEGDATWKQENLLPFDELILSWNAIRPQEGNFLFYIRVKSDSWSPWLLYASWGSQGQSTFLNIAEDSSLKIFQDTVEILHGKKATGFQIKILTEGNASLENIHTLHAYTNSNEILEPLPLSHSSLFLSVPALSQMTLTHPRCKDLCSPTSTSAVLRYLSHEEIDPILFAEKVWDSGFDIYGNWILNVAEAAAKLGPRWNVWVERLHGFDAIYHRLLQGTPVVVSVKGPLPGSALPYAQGHLIAIMGYDSERQQVLVMDPAFPSNQETKVFYTLSDFLQAWNRRGRVAYIFSSSLN